MTISTCHDQIGADLFGDEDQLVRIGAFAAGTHFRFRGDAYRAALHSLLAAAGGERRRVLLIGARAAVLAKLAAALRIIGIGADITRDAAGVPPDELRVYGAVAFGRAVTDEERAAVRRSFDAAGADVAYVEGLAPIVPLLVAQIEHALDRSPREQRRLTGLVAAAGEATETEV